MLNKKHNFNQEEQTRTRKRDLKDTTKQEPPKEKGLMNKKPCNIIF